MSLPNRRRNAAIFGTSVRHAPHQLAHSVITVGKRVGSNRRSLRVGHLAASRVCARPSPMSDAFGPSSNDGPQLLWHHEDLARAASHSRAHVEQHPAPMRRSDVRGVRAECCHASSTGSRAPCRGAFLNPSATRRRVECGWITSSIKPLLAATNGLAKHALHTQRCARRSPRGCLPRKMISTAPLAPITAISAVGHA